MRRTIPVIDNRFTKYKRRISLHSSTLTTTSSSLERARRSEAHDHPDNGNDAAEGSAINRRQGVSIEPAPTNRYLWSRRVPLVAPVREVTCSCNGCFCA
jgi:hypothetical protein